jgi:SsrA-binding protein
MVPLFAWLAVVTLVPAPAAPRAGAQMAVAARGKKVVASNRLARRNYEILEDFEAGVSLFGTEVKSCRAGKCVLRDGFCRIEDGECWLYNVNIARHPTASYFQHEETRKRRLLLHKREIKKLEAAVMQKGLTVVPLSAYFNEKSFLKISIGLAKGKQLQDKREDLKRRDVARETARTLKNF